MIFDANIFRIGQSRSPSADISAVAILKKWSISSDTVLGWSVGPTLQSLEVPSLHNGTWTLGARSHFAIAHRFATQLKGFASVGIGVHKGTLSEMEMIGHIGIMLPHLFLPDTMAPMIQMIGGGAVFLPQSGRAYYLPIYGAGVGVRWCF